MSFSNYNEFLAAAEKAEAYLRDTQRSVVSGDGSRTFMYHEAGAGEAVLVLPMLGELNFLFAPLIQRLTLSFRVLTYSPQVSTQHFLSPETRAAELDDFIDALKLMPVHIISWSDTCATACQYLQRDPSVVRSVVFIGVPDVYRFPFLVHSALHAFHRLPLEWLPVKASVFKLLGRFMGGPILRPAWVTLYAHRVPNLVRLFKYACLPSLLSHHAPRRPLTIPSLVLAGDFDPVVPAWASRAFAKTLGLEAQFRLLPELEHIPTFAQPEILSQAILRFLNR